MYMMTKMIINKPVWLFAMSKPEAMPFVVPMSNWIYAANDDVIYSKDKQ